MKITTSKSKNSESFYITKGYINDKGVSTSVIIRKLGTLNELLSKSMDQPVTMLWHGPGRKQD